MDATGFRAALTTGDGLVLDGGLATQLEAQGHDLSDRLWSARLLIEAPEAIVEAHLAYFRAGARVATTASYQATFEGFSTRGLTHGEAAALMRRSVDLASDARARFVAEAGPSTPGGTTPGGTAPGLAALHTPRFVAASIGPYGAMLADGSEYRGRYGRSMEQLRDFHRDRLTVLASTHADVLAVETIPEPDEARAVADLLAETPGAAAWISFACADGGHVRGGASIEAAVAAVDGSPGVIAVGVNCTPPEHVEELVGRIRAVTTLPIVVYPNSGEGWDAAARRWTGPRAGRVDGAAAARWRAAGATLIGGCCRVTPGQIERIAAGLADRAGT